MNMVYIHFNADGTIRLACLRVNGEKVKGMDQWEVWDFYQFLLALGRKPIEITYPGDGTTIHMITY